MATKSADKSEWNALIQKVKAIREMGIATAQELADYIKAPKQRLTEWIGGKKEPRAEKTLEIQKWVKLKEDDLEHDGRWEEYMKVLRKPKRAIEI